MKNKQIVITNQDSKLPLQKSKNLFDITRKILDKKELIESFLFKPFIMESAHTDRITTISISESEKYIVSGSIDRTLKIWTFDTLECLCTFDNFNRVDLVKITPCENYIISEYCEEFEVYSKQIIKVWDIKNKECLNSLEITWENSRKRYRRILISPNSEYFVLEFDNEIKIFNLLSKECLNSFIGHNIDITPDSNYIFFINEISEEFITLNDFILSMLKKMLEAKNIENLIKVLISFTIKLETEFQIQEKKKLEAIPIVKEKENDLSMLLSSIQSNNTDLSTIMEEHIVVDDGSSEIEKMLEENHKRLEEEKFFSQNATSNELLVKKAEILEKDNITENYLNSEKEQIEEVASLNETIIDSQEDLNNLLSNYDNISSSSETILNEEENETIINNIHSSNGVGLHNDIYSTNRIGLHENNNLSYENEVNEISETTNTYSNNEIELLEDNKEIINDIHSTNGIGLHDNQVPEEDNSELENLLSNYEDDFIYKQEKIKYEDEYEEEELDFNELNFDDNTSYSSNNENKLEENNENLNNTKINENESNNLNSLLVSIDNENQVKDDLSINFDENEETTNEDLNLLLTSIDDENQKSNDLNNSLNELKLNNDTYSSNTLQKNQEITTLIENNEPNSIEDLLSNVNNEEVELNFNETLEENNEFKNIDSLNEFEKKEKLLNENNQEQELDFSEDNNLDIIFNEKEETPMVSINKNKEIDYLKKLPLNKNNEEPNKIKELEKIINTKTPFVQKEDIITKEPKSVVDLVFQDLPKTNIINDDKLLSPIEVSEYIFKLLEEIESLKDKINKLEKQNT